MPDLTLHLFCDSSSARQLATRRGCGKIRHLQWLQDKFAAAVFQLHPLPTKENLNDLMTKSLRATAGDSNFGDQILLAWEPVLAQTRPRILHVTSCSDCLPPHRSARAASQAASAYGATLFGEALCCDVTLVSVQTRENCPKPSTTVLPSPLQMLPTLNFSSGDRKRSACSCARPGVAATTSRSDS